MAHLASTAFAGLRFDFEQTCLYRVRAGLGEESVFRKPSADGRGVEAALFDPGLVVAMKCIKKQAHAESHLLRVGRVQRSQRKDSSNRWVSRVHRRALLCSSGFAEGGEG